jgi:nucleotide-binding universal stress UspA family protein
MHEAGSAAGPLIVCYDGSPEAEDALAYAAEVLPGWRAIIVSAWKPIVEEALSTAARPPVADPVEANKAERRSAEQVAAEGARRASKAGLQAKPLTVEADGPLWEAIELLAEERDAKLIACGTKRSGVKAALPGSLAGALVTHASRAVLVVPSATAAADRRRDIQEERAQRRTLAGRVAEAAKRAKPTTSASASHGRDRRR